jgi:hypothetical protein
MCHRHNGLHPTPPNVDADDANSRVARDHHNAPNGEVTRRQLAIDELLV